METLLSQKPGDTVCYKTGPEMRSGAENTTPKLHSKKRARPRTPKGLKTPRVSTIARSLDGWLVELLVDATVVQLGAPDLVLATRSGGPSEPT